MLKKKKISYISEESDTQTHKLKKRLKECQKQKEEYLTQAQQARADLINFRRRQEQFLEELKKYGQADFIKELLQVLDSLEIGSKNNEDLKQIQEQLEDILRKYNLKEIKTKGEKFNPEFHEAVEQVKSKEESGIIIQEIQKGYIIEDKVLRASKVKVAK
ncbi:MAG: nucleotide exchange factor GrpE [Parcubacteria group bacterium]|nr:nucleotide exchange factor GrpE [Parcubacteria group bacterium]